MGIAQLLRYAYQRRRHRPNASRTRNLTPLAPGQSVQIWGETFTDRCSNRRPMYVGRETDGAGQIRPRATYNSSPTFTSKTRCSMFAFRIGASSASRDLEPLRFKARRLPLRTCQQRLPVLCGRRSIRRETLPLTGHYRCTSRSGTALMQLRQRRSSLQETSQCL